MRRPVLLLSVVGLTLGLVGTPAPAAPKHSRTPSAKSSGDPLDDTLCSGRSPCKDAGRQSAGNDGAGQPLTVVHLTLGHDHDDENCLNEEYWLAVGDLAHPTSTRLLLQLCNDGYGAAGVGEDDVAVKPNQISWTEDGGSNWRWGNGRVLQLAPLTFLSDTNQSYWTLGNNVEQSTWSWATFSGRDDWYSPTCGPDGTEPDPDGDVDIGELPSDGKYYSYDLVPSVTLDPAYVAGGWKSASPGTCSDVVDGSPGHGFTISGAANAASPAADSSMRVTASPDGTLYVEITDDHWVDGAANWIDDDHLELWMLSGDSGDWESCVSPPSGGSLIQWGIRASDGAVFPGYGKPSAKLGVERAPGTNPVRFKLTLPWGSTDPSSGFFALVYSDSDDGKTQERLIATSNLSYGVAWTLGQLRAVDNEVATCALTGGALTPHVPVSTDPSVPVLHSTM
jgi:hypothetical protein